MSDCCKEDALLVLSIKENDTGKMVVKQCPVCDKKHYRLRADSLSIGMKGSSMGG